MITNAKTASSMKAPLNVLYMRGIRERVFNELTLMAQQLGMRMGDEPFAAIYRTAAEHLFAIENLCYDGDIDPRAWICASHDDAAQPSLSAAAAGGLLPDCCQPFALGPSAYRPSGHGTAPA